jgi:FYVE/RhoGEF/PH domain-containing protein 5/6
MLKPVQRLPQYRLLLEDYLKHLDEDGEDFNDTVDALRIVAEVAEQADNTIKHGVSLSSLFIFSIHYKKVFY